MKGRIVYSNCMKEAKNYPFSRCLNLNVPPPYEPDYESRSHGRKNGCHQHSIIHFSNTGETHMFYVTNYKGKLGKYRNRWFIIGYLADIEYDQNDSNVVLQGSENSKFVSIQNAWEVTRDSWKKLGIPKPFPGYNRGLGSANHLWHEQVRYLLKYFEYKENEIDMYIRPSWAR